MSDLRLAYQYVVLRCVPRVDREEFVNVGVVLYCQATDFLGVAWQVDRDRLRAFDPTLDLDQVCEALAVRRGRLRRRRARGSGGPHAAQPAVRLPQGPAQHRPPARPGPRRRHHRPGRPARAPAGEAGRLTQFLPPPEGDNRERERPRGRPAPEDGSDRTRRGSAGKRKSEAWRRKRAVTQKRRRDTVPSDRCRTQRRALGAGSAGGGGRRRHGRAVRARAATGTAPPRG